MKLSVLLFIGLGIFVDATFASKCIGECDFLNEYFLAHEDCDKYCVCLLHGDPIEFSCLEGLHFSNDSQTCVEPSKANCRDVTLPPLPTLPPVTPSPPVDQNGCIGTCPSQNSDDFTVLLPNTNCSMYCMCNWGTAIPKNCTPGLVFNNDTQTCDFPFNVDCPNITYLKNNVNFYESKLVPIVLDNFEQVNKQKKAGCRPKVQEDEGGCLGKCPHSNSLDHTVHLAHKECSKFCKCNWGQPIVMNCPENLHFNSKSETCDFVFTANCTGIGKIEDLFQ